MKPVYLGAEVALSNQQVKAPANASNVLANPFSAPMLIQQINITARDALGFYGFTASVGLELTLGNHTLTDSFVPITLVSEPQEFSGGVIPTTMRWILSRPLLIPAGQYLFPRFYHSGRGGTSAITVRISYIGQSLESGDEALLAAPRYMPYVASWIPTSRAGGANYTDKSTESNLRNPFSEPLEVVAVGGQVFTAGVFAPVVAGDASIFQSTLIRAVNQDGAVVIKDSSEFFTLFGVDGFWRGNFSLPGNGYLVMNLTENYSALPGATTYFPQFSMIGYRAVR